MSNYAKCYRELIRLYDLPLEQVFKMVVAMTRIDPNPPDPVKDAELIRQHSVYEHGNWGAEINRLEQSHIFEFDNDVSFLLTMTQNDMKREITHVPFDDVFIDCDFEFENEGQKYHYIGLHIRECTGYDPATKAGNTEQFKAYAAKRAREGDPIDLATYPIAAQRDNPTWPLHHIVVVGFLQLPDGTLLDVRHNLDLDDNARIQLEFEQGITLPTLDNNNPFDRKEKAEFKNIVLNFLDVLDTKEIRLAHIPEKPMTEKRKARGQLPMPPRDRVLLTAPIRNYVDSLKKGGHFTYSHAFWVRGHIRHYQHDRYAKSGLQGTVQWIPPHIKGKGIVVKKAYDVETKFSTT